METPIEKPLLGVRFPRALDFAAMLHNRQVRKMTGTPYVSHLLAVTALVLEYGGSEDAAIAAVLHDALEDQSAHYHTGADGLRRDIKNLFGEHVLSIVEELTETDEDPKPPWKFRKVQYISHLVNASPEAILVAACDKIHNARTTLNDIRLHGEKTWEKFNSDKASQEWWYQEIVAVLHCRQNEKKDLPIGLADEMERLFREMFR